MSVERPLAGRTVVVTRARPQARTLSDLLEARGASVLAVPAIEVVPPASWAPLDAALRALDGFDWAVFTSVNGVDAVGRRLATLGQNWSAFGRLRLAAIGPATARALDSAVSSATSRARHGGALVPGEYRAEALVEALGGVLAPGARVLVARAAGSRDVLIAGLEARGARVTEVHAYATRRGGADAGELRRALDRRQVDVVTFTSSSTVEGFAGLFAPAERGRWFADLTVASIGPITAATAARWGLATRIMPTDYTIPALADAVAGYFAAGADGPSWRLA